MHGGGKILLGCLMMNCPPTLLLLPTSRWVSSLQRALPIGPFQGFLPDFGVLRFTARRGHAIRNFLRKGMGLSVPQTDDHSKFRTIFISINYIHLPKIRSEIQVRFKEFRSKFIHLTWLFSWDQPFRPLSIIASFILTFFYYIILHNIV